MSTNIKASLLGQTLEVSVQNVFDGPPPKPVQSDGEKPDNTLRIVGRAKRQVLELASSNNWQYFVTATIDPAKSDRTVHAVQDGFRNFARYANRKVQYADTVRYVGVPEPHPNGWGYHAHALVACPDAVLVPFEPSEYRKLPFALKRAYERAKSAGRKIYHCPWMDKHMGWNLWEPISSPERIQNYITKYIDKTLVEAAQRASGGASPAGDVSNPAETRCAGVKRPDLYFHSRGLNTAPERVLEHSTATYELLDELQELHDDILRGDPDTGRYKARAWLGFRIYNGDVMGRTYRVDRANVSSEQWEKLLRLAGLDPVSLAVLKSG